MEKKKVDEISRPLMTRSNPGDKFIVAYCLMYRSDMVPKDDEFCEVECVVASRIRWATLLLGGWTRDSQHTKGS